MKSSNIILDPSHPLLKDLLDKYPQFLDTNTSSIHYRYNNVLAGALNELQHNLKILEHYMRIDRPLKIWKEQKKPKHYTIYYQTNLENLKQVQLYKEDENILLEDEKIPKGIEKYENSYTTTSKEIIPSERYYITVETYDGLIFQKGYPENDTIKGDIYDHDQALDNLGKLFNIPRRKYQTKLTEMDYPFTYPTFCNSQTEDDYYYEKRLQKTRKNWKNTSLPVWMLENIFQITPTINGRWKYVTRMDRDVMGPEEDAKYMASLNWNNNTYTITYNLENIPKNLQIPSKEDIKNVLRDYFPLGSQIHFGYNRNISQVEYPTLQTKIEIKDHITFTIQIKEKIKPKDIYTYTPVKK